LCVLNEKLSTLDVYFNAKTNQQAYLLFDLLSADNTLK